jgi:hypothetical protein
MPSDKPLLFAFTDPVEGREDDFNAWYDETHVADVLKVPGIVSAQRYALAPGARSTHRYLAVYEIEGDPMAAAKALFAGLKSGEVPMSDCIDGANAAISVWVPHGETRHA